jgi:hypothetical protein
MQERIVLLAPEGLQEVENEGWVRDASQEEIEAFKQRHGLTEEEYRDIIVDGMKRPYWLVTVLEEAPEVAEQKAASYARVRSLLW